MSLARVLSAIVVVVILGGWGPFGCGGTELDDQKTEDQVKDSVEKTRGSKVTSVDCESGVEVEPGTVFSCEVTLPGGKTETAKLRIRDEDANVDFFKLSPNK